MSAPLSFEDYLDSLSDLTPHVDPTAVTPATEDIRGAVDSLAALKAPNKASLSKWVALHPRWAYVLGIIVGLSLEKQKNQLRHRMGTSGWATLARKRPDDLIAFLDTNFNLVEMVQKQLRADYGLADVLIARAGTRVTAARAGVAGRLIEDKIEAIAKDLGLPYVTRTTFVGSHGRRGPGDLVIPDSDNAVIVVAAKGFDSTGSKQSDTFREIEAIANVRQPRQFIMAVVDGIGWKSRKADLYRVYSLWATGRLTACTQWLPSINSGPTSKMLPTATS